MIQDNSSEEYNPPKVDKPKITQERVYELFRAFSEISPEMEATEVFRRTQEYMNARSETLTDSKKKELLIKDALRKERLKRQGLNPSEWTFYTNASPTELKAGNINAPFTEADMAKWSSRFPKGIELCVIQGGVSATSLKDQQEEREPFTEIPSIWEIYIKVRPDTIPVAKIEGPDEEITTTS